MSGRRRAGRAETTDDWQQLKLLARWPEQARYELIRPIVLEKPKGPSRAPRAMPFASGRRHEFWTADVRYIDHRLGGGQAYVLSVLENHSRAILASGLFRSQDLTAFLSVLYRANSACIRA